MGDSAIDLSAASITDFEKQARQQHDVFEVPTLDQQRETPLTTQDDMIKELIGVEIEKNSTAKKVTSPAIAKTLSIFTPQKTSERNDPQQL